MPRFSMDYLSNHESYLSDATRVVLDRAIATTQVSADWDLHLDLVRQLATAGHPPKQAAMMATEYQKEKTGVDVSELPLWWNAHFYVSPPPIGYVRKSGGFPFVWVRVGGKFTKYTMPNQHPWLDLVRDARVSLVLMGSPLKSHQFFVQKRRSPSRSSPSPSDLATPPDWT